MTPPPKAKRIGPPEARVEGDPGDSERLAIEDDVFDDAGSCHSGAHSVASPLVLSPWGSSVDLFMSPVRHDSEDDGPVIVDAPAGPEGSSSTSSSFSFSDVSVDVVDLNEFLLDECSVSSSEDSMAHLDVASSSHMRPPPTKGAAEYVVRVPGGILRIYESSGTMVASCDKHGSRCRLTRFYTLPKRHGREGQGRCIGLLCAWLILGTNADIDNRDQHAHMEAPTYDDRVNARVNIQDVDGIRPFLEHEQKEDGDPDEPLVIP